MNVRGKSVFIIKNGKFFVSMLLCCLLSCRVTEVASSDTPEAAIEHTESIRVDTSPSPPSDRLHWQQRTDGVKIMFLADRPAYKVIADNSGLGFIVMTQDYGMETFSMRNIIHVDREGNSLDLGGPNDLSLDFAMAPASSSLFVLVRPRQDITSLAVILRRGVSFSEQSYFASIVQSRPSLPLDPWDHPAQIFSNEPDTFIVVFWDNLALKAAKFIVTPDSALTRAWEVEVQAPIHRLLSGCAYITCDPFDEMAHPYTVQASLGRSGTLAIAYNPGLYSYDQTDPFTLTMIDTEGEVQHRAELQTGLKNLMSVRDLAVDEQNRVLMIGRFCPMRVKVDCQPAPLLYTPYATNLDILAPLGRIGSSIALSASALPGNGWLIGGSEGYWENDHGVSVGSDRRAFALVLDGQGKPTREIQLPQQARGNEVRSVHLSADGSLWMGGAHGAPGSHDADLRADGFVMHETFSH